ncbi:uncharacterized protein TNCV_4717671 [Trichonephila clavipes]|nr:uncharacterized protein TNCV_4717671 [Trichonephila clavipes]
MFLAGHPSQGCFGLQSHCAPCYFFNQASFYPSDFSFRVFGVFNLAFMQFKRVKPDGFYTSTILDLNLPEEYMKLRIFSVGWPPTAEWAGLILCLIGSLFWLLLAKIYRFQILSPT